MINGTHPNTEKQKIDELECSRELNQIIQGKSTKSSKFRKIED
jgi:hypothetical protein